MKNKWLRLAFGLLIGLAFIGLVFGDSNDRPPYAIRAGKILTITEGVILDGLVLVKNGKIEKVGKDITIPSGYIEIDASNHWLLPGFVDIHSHTGGEGYGDINDMVFSLNPGLRILDTTK